MNIFDRAITSLDKKLKADEGASHSQKPHNGQFLALVIFGGLLLTPVVAICSGYTVTTSAEVTPGKVGWKFEGKPALPPFQKP